MEPVHSIAFNWTQPLEAVGGVEWIAANPVIAWPFLIIGSAISVFGSLGNIASIFAILLNKQLRHVRNAFLLNMSVADLIVTAFADPMSVLGMVAGKEFFEQRPGLCDVVATLCMAACIAALFSLGAISFFQCLTICYPDIYARLFSARLNIALCISFWVIGTLISLPPLVGWTHIIFDAKYLECIFNRLHSESYTSFYSGVVVATPLFIISFSYLKIFTHVQASKRRIEQMKIQGKAGGEKGGTKQSLRLARTLVGIFMVFVICWGPFAILIVVDREDRGHMALHLYILLLAHMHASLNPLVYLLTNKHYRHGFRLFFAMICPCLRISTRVEDGTAATNGGASVTGNTAITSVHGQLNTLVH